MLNHLGILTNPIQINLSVHRTYYSFAGILYSSRRTIFLTGTASFVSKILSHAKLAGLFDGEFLWIIFDVNLALISTEKLVPGLLVIRPKVHSAEDFISRSTSIIVDSLTRIDSHFISDNSSDFWESFRLVFFVINRLDNDHL